MELSAFYAAYRDDGHGRAAHDPAMMVALLLYAYAVGRRSSRVIERACVDDVAFRVIAASQRPDHCTIARFRRRRGQSNQDSRLVRAMERHGFYWGGDFPTVPDPMHFEFRGR
jgi:transposase